MLDYLLNCFLLLLPVFIWNMVFANKLPEKYTSKGTWDHIPKLLAALENTLRTIVFLLPVLMILDLSGPRALAGAMLYGIGILVYFFSWLMQMKKPDSTWSNSLAGSMAPAYTPILWLSGIAMIGRYNFLDIPGFSLFYFVVSLVFVMVHTLHAYLAFKQTSHSE